jgi:hypothetical protein
MSRRTNPDQPRPTDALSCVVAGQAASYAYHALNHVLDLARDWGDGLGWENEVSQPSTSNQTLRTSLVAQDESSSRAE